MQTTSPQFKVATPGGDTQEGEDHPLADGERAEVGPVQSLVQSTAEARMVGVRVLLHEALGQSSVLVKDQLLHQLGDGEHSQLAGAPSLLHDEVGDVLGRLHVVFPNKQQWQLSTSRLHTEKAGDLSKKILHVVIVVRELRGETVGVSGRLDTVELVAYWHGIQRRHKLEKESKLN